MASALAPPPERPPQTRRPSEIGVWGGSVYWSPSSHVDASWVCWIYFRKKLQLRLEVGPLGLESTLLARNLLFVGYLGLIFWVKILTGRTNNLHFLGAALRHVPLVFCWVASNGYWIRKLSPLASFLSVWILFLELLFLVSWGLSFCSLHSQFGFSSAFKCGGVLVRTPNYLDR